MQIGPFVTDESVLETSSQGAITYIAHHERTQERFFLTLYHPRTDADGRNWGERIRLLRTVPNPHIWKPTIGGKTQDNALYVAMPFARPLLNTALNLPSLLRMIAQVSAALDAAYEHGITHGKLRPTHIVISGRAQCAVRGYELSSNNVDRQVDVRAFAHLIESALTDYVTQTHNDETEPLFKAQQVLEAAQRGEFATATALSQAVAASLADEPAPTLSVTQLTPARRLMPVRLLLILLGVVALGLLGFMGALVVQRIQGTPTPPAIIQLASEVPTTTHTFTPPATFTLTATTSNTPLPSATATFTVTASRTAPPTATIPGLVTTTPLPTFTPSMTPTLTLTPSITPTPTITPSVTATSLPTTTPRASATSALSLIQTSTKECVSVVGDSVTAGTGVYEVPGVGYAFVHSLPVASFVEKALRNVGWTNYNAYNRGAPNTGISTDNHPSYFASDQYRSLLQDRCRYIIVMPWINDITPNQPQTTAMPHHMDMLAELIRTEIANNPYGRVIVLNYYMPVVSPFAAASWAAGFNPDGIALYNQGLAASCTSGRLYSMPQVVCVDISGLFAGMGESHVIKYANSEMVYGTVAEPLSKNAEEFLGYYFRQNPGGTVLGDGVHLSTLGKERLGQFLATTLTQLPPPAKIENWSKG